MAYHLPRVIYWAQAHSVAFFPTPYLNQISQPPLAEYLMLHSFLLTGGDRLVNLLTFGAFLASIIGISALAGAMGLRAPARRWRRWFAPPSQMAFCKLPEPRTTGS